MINCPKCGAANPDSNLFCDKCDTMLTSRGASSASGGRRCPMCGKVNPPDSVTCSSCGARLVPVSGPLAQEPPPAPPRPAAAEATAVKKVAPPAPAPQPPGPAPSASEDWLSNLRGAISESPAPEEEIPDWLRGEPTAPAGPEVEPPAFDLAARLGGARPAQSEVPDWLSQPSPAAPTPSSAEGDVPDWLKQSAPAPRSASVPSAPAPLAPSEADVPDWLKPLAPAAAVAASKPAPAPTPRAAPVPPVPTTPTPAEAELPDWLKPPAPAPGAKPVSTPSPATSAAPTPGEAEIPDWLKEFGTTPAPVEAEVPLASVEPSGAPTVAEPEAPDWLREIMPAAPSAPPPSGPAFIGEPAPEPVEAPQWLSEITSQPAPAAAQAELPDWLKELEPQAPAEQPIAPLAEAPALIEEAPVQPPGEAPAWLKELGPSEAPTAPQPVFTEGVAPVPAPTAGGLVAAQLPAWLQKLAPTGQVPKEQEKEEPVETEGILAGVRGPLPVAAVVTQAATGEPRRVRPEISEADLANASALQELLARGPAVVVRRETESRAQKLWSNTQRWIIFLVILVVALIPLLQEQWVVDLGLVSAPKLSQAASDMYKSIDALGSASTVLMAFDYDATQSPEMDTQASVLLRHLSARQASVDVLSLYPSGPAVAQAVINQTLPVTDRVRIENHGYVPGQDVGVALISTKPYSMVIELAASPDTVRWWVEQMAANPGAPPLLAGVSAAAEPMSQPYYSGKRVVGMLAGVPDATAYWLELQNKKVAQEKDSLAHMLAPLASISAANLILAVLIVLGGLIQLAAGGGKRR